MLGSSFQEGSSAAGGMLQIQVTDVEPKVLYAALRWVYTDRVDADMPAEQLLQVRATPCTHLAKCGQAMLAVSPLSIMTACIPVGICVVHPE